MAPTLRDDVKAPRPAGHDPAKRPCCGAEVPARGLGVFEWLRPRRRAVVRALGAMALLAPGTVARAAQVLANCGATPKPPRPAQALAAEGLPPLPLPVVPQRRTEKKNPPRPPVIVSKIKTSSLADWGTDLNDVNNLLAWMKANLDVNFTYEEKPLGGIPLESGQVPVLYRTGHNAFTFSPLERTRLRAYVERGGMIIFDACCGRRTFTDAARREIAAIMPDRPLRPIGLDHPIFNCYYENAGFVRFTEHTLARHGGLSSPGPSGMEGVEIACRMAIVLAPHDLSCGWDMHTHVLPDTSYIESEDALRIGANLMAYATATRDLSVGLAHSKAYVDADPTRADKFRVAQLMHAGDWNPDPVGLRNLLDTVARSSALKISFATEAIEPTADRLGMFPFLYITGHDDFAWTQDQVNALRAYLANGGFVLADACCGRQKFDLAFRREIGRVLGPNGSGGTAGRLAPLPQNHPLYHLHHKIDTVRYSEAANARFGRVRDARPRLEAAGVDGRIAVLYSPIGLNVGWRMKPVPYAANYESDSALALGVNAALYAMSQ